MALAVTAPAAASGCAPDPDALSDWDASQLQVETRPRAWRVSEVIGDYVRLAGDENYGMIDDLVFSEAGELHAGQPSPPCPPHSDLLGKERRPA